MTSQCAQHFERIATGTCSRCGRFCCQGCSTRFGCVDCRARAIDALPPIERLGTWAAVAMTAIAVACLLAILGHFVWLRVEADPDPLLERVEHVVNVLRSVVGTLALAAVTVLGPTWFYRAARHALARDVKLGVGPVAALVTLFVPLVQHVWPFRILRTMFVSAGLKPTVINVWQLTWVLSMVLAVLATSFKLPRLHELVLAFFAMACVSGARAMRMLSWR